MRKLMISTVSLIALASSSEHSLAQAASPAPKHTWYQINADTATCTLSDKTPEQFQSFISGWSYLRSGDPIGQTIEPKDVYKDPYGNIVVTVRVDKDGSRYWRFYTSKDSCELTAKTLKPVQAPSSDIN